MKEREIIEALLKALPECGACASPATRCFVVLKPVNAQGFGYTFQIGGASDALKDPNKPTSIASGSNANGWPSDLRETYNRCDEHGAPSGQEVFASYDLVLAASIRAARGERGDALAELRDAVARASFRLAPDLQEAPTLWCTICGRDSGFHYASCSKANKKAGGA